MSFGNALIGTLLNTFIATSGIDRETATREFNKMVAVCKRLDALCDEIETARALIKSLAEKEGVTDGCEQSDRRSSASCGA